MDATSENQGRSTKSHTTAERKSDRELVVSRTFDGPARLVWEAWTKPELFKRWWAPKSFGLSIISCEMDVRVGGSYRLVIVVGNDAAKAMPFFGRYTEVTPYSRLVWTNDEGEGPGPVTTLTLEERGGKTLLVKHDLYPSKEALDADVASGATGGVDETFAQLDAILVTLGERS
jgi:uncharacterized protein YndB with AHSA1/START domain